MKNNERSVFIGAGFINNQIPWILPIVIGYCKKNNITNIILDRKVPDVLLKLDYLTNDLKNFNILYLSDVKFYFKFTKFIKKKYFFKYFFFNIFLFFYFLFVFYSFFIQQLCVVPPNLHELHFVQQNRVSKVQYQKYS